MVGVFFGLALIMTAARTAIRVHRFRRVFVDDYFLFLAVASLIASTGLFFSLILFVYTFAAVAAGPAGLESAPLDYINAAINATNVAYAADALACTTVFAVKLSFLFFFRHLIQRLRDLKILWWCVLMICIPVGIVCICLPFIVCPYVGKLVIGSFWIACPVLCRRNEY